MIKACSDPKTAMRFNRLVHLIGNTPMLRLNYQYEDRTGSVFVKCEHYNLTGSIKDRMALHILERSCRLGMLNPGDRVVEATSGNTGISFAALGKALGHRVTIIMPDWLSTERIAIIESLGAEIILMSKDQDGFKGCLQMANEIKAANNNVFLPRQFENYINPLAHEQFTAKEIWLQLRQLNLKPDAFVAGVGTGGTIMGAGTFFRSKNPLVKVHPLEPEESPTLTTGYKSGNHRIQGISDEFVPDVLKLNELDGIVQVSDGDAILMAQKLARELGLGVGISSGANVVGAIKIQQKMKAGAVVVTVFPDSNKKYLSTDLMRKEAVREDYISSKVELIDYEPIPRLS